MIDFIIDEKYNLQFLNGDLATGFSDNQHQQHILIANKGEYKAHPEVGVGIEDLLSDDNYTATLLEAKKQLEYDGMTIYNIIYNNENLNIDGQY